MLQALKTYIRNNQIFTKNILSVFALKGVALLLSFVMTPMYIVFFENNSFLGVWYTILSIMTWILTFDLGIGNGLRNNLAYALAQKNKLRCKSLISSAYISLGVFSTIVFVVLWLIIPWVNWQKVLNSNIDAEIIQQVITLLLLGLVIQFFFKIVVSILYAIRKTAYANLLPVLTNMMILFFLLFSPETSDNSRFVLLAIVYSIASILPLIISTIIVFSTTLKEYRPSYKNFSIEASKQVLMIGGLFFFIQIGLLVVNSTNQVLINTFFGGEAVVQYTVYYRLYYMAIMFFSLITQPTWSEISIKYGESNIRWIKKAYRFLLLISSVIVACTIAVTMALKKIFLVWLGSNNIVPVNYTTGIVFLIWIAIELVVMSSTCVANGMSKLRIQAVTVGAAAVLKVPVTFVLVSIWKDWASIIVAHSIVLLPIAIFQSLGLRRHLLH